MTQEQIRQTLELELALYALYDSDPKQNELELTEAAKSLYLLHLKSKIELIDRMIGDGKDEIDSFQRLNYKQYQLETELTSLTKEG